MSVSVIKVQGSGPAKIEVIQDDTQCEPAIWVTDTRVLEIGLGGQASAGSPGESAYQLAVASGFNGTEADWLQSLAGADGLDGVNGQDGRDGVDGVNGLSAYELAVAGGFVGTQAEWLQSLQTSTAETFNTVSLNLKAYPVSAAVYSEGVPVSLTYDLGGGQTIVKSITWTDGLPSTIQLSGDTPEGIPLTRNLSWSGFNFAGDSYE